MNEWGPALLVCLTVLIGIIFNNRSVDKLEKNLKERIDTMERNLNQRIDTLEKNVNQRIDDLKDWIRSEVKRLEDRIQRVEAPPIHKG